MKFKLTFKDPDGVYEGLRDVGFVQGECPESVELVMNKFITYGEYVTVELDTDTMTATVVPTK